MGVNLKNINDLPELASLKGTEKLLVNDGGFARSVPAKAITGVQADWYESNPSSPAFIMNKPNLNQGSSASSKAVYSIYNGTTITKPSSTTSLTSEEVKELIRQFHTSGVLFSSGSLGSANHFNDVTYSGVAGSMIGYFPYYGSNGGNELKISYINANGSISSIGTGYDFSGFYKV